MNVLAALGFEQRSSIRSSLSTSEIKAKLHENVGPPPSFAAPSTAGIGVVDVPWRGVVSSDGAWFQTASKNSAIALIELAWQSRGSVTVVELHMRPTSFAKLVVAAFSLVIGAPIVLMLVQLLGSASASRVGDFVLPIAIPLGIFTSVIFSLRRQFAAESSELEARLSHLLREPTL